MVTDQDLYSLCKSEMEYRNKLLEKYANILTRSEGRVDNINHMIGDLIKMSNDCGVRFEKEQENTSKLIDLLVEKDKRIHELEVKIADDDRRYQDLVERYINNNSKVNENTFNLASK